VLPALSRPHLDRYRASGAELIMGHARFTAPRTVEVELAGGGTRRIHGDRVFLNLGTHATMPDLPGLAAARPMTHVELLDLDRLPGHLIVVGGGYVGLELAQAMRRFGARVTVIEQGPQLAEGEDADVAAAVLQLFGDEGIEMLLGTQVRGWRDNPAIRYGCTRPDQTAPTTSSGPTCSSPSAAPRTRQGSAWRRLESSFTHVAFDDFRVVRDNLHGGTRSTVGRLVPSCMFLDPELARVGDNETEASRRGLGYRLLTLPMAAVLRTRTLSEPRGFLKMLIAADSDQILGFTAFGAEASELMAAVQVAMMAGLPYTALRAGIFAHPTAAEGLTFLLAGTPAPAQ
jgi:pyruvate/2-oxoglutarate dehydrogenase complex dihydrolipoamide dehydrogenase (E3) component